MKLWISRLVALRPSLGSPDIPHTDCSICRIINKLGAWGPSTMSIYLVRAHGSQPPRAIVWIRFGPECGCIPVCSLL